MIQFAETDIPLIISLISEQMAKAMMGDPSGIGVGTDGLLERILAGQPTDEDVELLNRMVHEKMEQTAGTAVEQDTKMLYAPLLEKLKR